MTATLASASEPACDPRLTGEFRKTLTSAAEQGDYRLLREAYGKGLKSIVGLTCDIPSLEGILRDAGYHDVGHIDQKNGITEVIGFIPASLLFRLLGRRYGAMARIGSSNGSTHHFSIGPIK